MVASRRWHNKPLARTIFAAICATSAAVTVLSTIVSTHNYPGGAALLSLNEHLRQHGSSANDTMVHLDSYSCMTGASNFLQDRRLAQFDKDESLTSASQYKGYDYLVTHDPAFHSKLFEVIYPIRGWAGITLQLRQWKDALARRNAAGLRRQASESYNAWLARVFPAMPRLDDQVWIMRNRNR